MFHKILVPLDGSTLAEEAMPTAMAVAKAAKAEVILLRSIQPVYTMMPVVAGEYEWIWPEYAREDSRREIRDYLDRVKGRHECAECDFRCIALEGDPASVIVDTAVEEDVDLIVMSTHGQTGIRRAVFGSVTERVLHSVSCPVIVTKANEPIRRVLIPLDGSELAERAIEPALEVTRAVGASLILLRINEIMPVPPIESGSPGWEWEVTEPKQRLVGELRQAAEGYLREIVLRYRLEPAEVQTIVLDGSPVDRIQEFARLYGIDLIAMSTHGHTGLRRWLYGSVTVKVMRASECSMLIIRPPAEELND